MSRSIAKAALDHASQSGVAEQSRWHGLRSRFLDSLQPADRQRIFDLGARAAQALDDWAARYPLVRRVRVQPLSLSVAAGAPFASVQALISTARLSLWVFTLDDVFDEEQLPDRALIRSAERYRALARGERPPPSGDSLATALREVRRDLATYRLFEPLADEWISALCGTIDGMLREHQWRVAYRQAGDAAALPSYAEYVATGRYSIGGPPHMWAAVITSDDLSAVDSLPHLRAMEQLASTCIRLANDLRSHDKEVAEGNVNGLVILSRELRARGVSPDDAHRQSEARVRADIEAGLEQLAALRSASQTRTGRPEAAIDNVARFVCDFYTHHDYHTLLAEAA